jgi:glycosyltransferase involved in cell wall biosynthesis
MNHSVDIASHKASSPVSGYFSILIPSWNNLPFLKNCVESIQKNSRFTHQIIIHINEGTDGTLEWVKEHGFDYTLSAENVGVCYALNAAAELATTDYILYINDDMYTCPDWDAYLWDEIQSLPHHKFYLSATMIEPVKTNNRCVIAPHLYGDHPDRFREADLLHEFARYGKKDWYGASWPPALVHRSMWQEVGGYDVAFSPGFGSDPDFSMKLWKAGVRHFKGLAKSRVYHFQSKSTGRVVKNDGRLIFTKKWGYTPSYFYKKVLKLGQDYTAAPLVFSKNADYVWARIKGLFTAIKS